MKYINDFDKGFLDNKNILVTGSTSGIGKELALGLSSYGANVILHGKNEDSLDEIYDEIIQKFNTNPIIVKCDLNDLDESKAQEFANAIQGSYERLDGIVNNAAIIGKMSTLADYDLSTWQKVININVTSSYVLTKYLVPLMEGSKNPRIIFTSSGVGRKGKAYWGAYAISKFATEGLVQILSEELEKTSGIRVNAINPGAVRTKMRAQAYPAEDPKTLKNPKEIMNAYLFLMGIDSLGITGKSIEAQ